MTTSNWEIVATLNEDWHENTERKHKKGTSKEWKKTCSRLAARSRRRNESALFKELTALLPLDMSTVGQQDKASVIRLTIAYLHLRKLLDTPDTCAVPLITPGISAKPHEREMLDSALGGFVIFLSFDGKVIFTTEGVTAHTGIHQLDLIGRSLFDFLHPCDQKEVNGILTELTENQGTQTCEVFLRIKRAKNKKLTPWKVIHCCGKKKSSAASGSCCLVLECRVLPMLEMPEKDSTQSTFMSVHKPDMNFTYCHSRVVKFIGFEDTELLGQSVYQLYHPSDCQQIRKAHICLFSKGHTSTGKYRLLHRHGGYVWAETDASLVYNSHTGLPEKVVCINYILSGVEQTDLAFVSTNTKKYLKPPSESLWPESLSTFLPLSKAPGEEIDLKIRPPAKPQHQRDGDKQEVHECTEILHITKDCYDFNCHLCDQDLDCLAPYIPMHGEDFPLTPILDEIIDCAELNFCSLLLNSPHEITNHQMEDQEAMATLPVTSFPQPIVNHCLSSDRARENNLTTKQNNGRLDLFNRFSKISNYNHKQRNDRLLSTESKRHHWREDAWKYSQHRIRRKWNNGPSLRSHALLGSKNRSLQEIQRPPNEVKPLALPVLSGQECEVNAPLEHTSYLLQGLEIIAVLDQVASRVPWC